MPVVICHLEAGESMITERGSMVLDERQHAAWKPTRSRRSRQGAFGRMFGGESHLPEHAIRRRGTSPGMIAFASSFPGAIRAVEITPEHAALSRRRAAFLACDARRGSLHPLPEESRRRLSSAARASSCRSSPASGMAFLEIDGSAVEYDARAADSQIIVDTGNLAMVDATCQIDIVRPCRGVEERPLRRRRVFSTPSSPVRGASYCRRWRCPPSRARSSRICRRSRTDAHTAKWIESGGRKPPPSIQNGYFFKGT